MPSLTDPTRALVDAYRQRSPEGSGAASFLARADDVLTRLDRMAAALDANAADPAALAELGHCLPYLRLLHAAAQALLEAQPPT